MRQAAQKKAGAGRDASGADSRERKTARGGSDRFRDALTIAQEEGLLAGGRTELLRGRMPKALVAKAKARSGIQSDTKLIEVALATLAVADEYPAWLISQRGTVSKDLNLEF